MTDAFSKHRRNVTPEEAGLAFLALRQHEQRGAPIAQAYIDVLLALAVDVVAPIERREEATP